MRIFNFTREANRVRRDAALATGRATHPPQASVAELIAAGGSLRAIVRDEVARQLAAQDLIDEERLP